MKVGIISDQLNLTRAGIGNYVFNLAKKLIKIDGRNIYLINYKENNSLPFRYNNIIVPYPSKIPFKRLLWHNYLWFKKGYLNELDIIHNPTHVQIFLKFNQKYIVTVHDILPFIPSEGYRLGRPLIYKLFFSRTLKTADKIIADSDSTKKDLINYFNVPEEKIKVILLAADKKFKPLNKEEINEVQKYNLKFPFILSVGTLELRKNIPTLIKAFYKLKKKNINYKLVITGKKGWKYKEIFETIDKLNLQNDVVFTGYVSDEDLPALYNASDLFVYPSRYEGFGLPPLEAMACGTPVITSNTSSLPEVVGDAGIMVDPYDADRLADVIYNVLTTDGLKENMIKKGLERAKMFSWEKCARETLKVYEEVYNQGGR